MKIYTSEYSIEKAQVDKSWLKIIQDKKYPPLAEISVDDICSSQLKNLTGMVSKPYILTVQYVQSVTLVSSSGYDEAQLTAMRNKKQKTKKQKKKPKKKRKKSGKYPL